MRQSISILLTAMSIFFLTSCEKVVGEGPVVTQVRAIENFKGVSASISGKVIYKIAPVYKVELQAQQNILDILQTNRVGDELIIKFQDGKNVRSHEDIIVTISAPVADWVNLSGSAEFSLEGELVAANLGLRVSGSGNIQVQDITLSEKLTATISGSGSITVQEGVAKNEALKVSGSGNINLQNLVAEKAVTEISGSGHMKVHLTQSLDASISGSGSVFYKGTPVISTHISGSGRVAPL